MCGSAVSSGQFLVGRVQLVDVVKTTADIQPAFPLGAVWVVEDVNEQFMFHRDLLTSDNGNKLDVKMKPEGGGYHVPGLVTVAVSSLQDVNRVISSWDKAQHCSNVALYTESALSVLFKTRHCSDVALSTESALSVL